MLHLRMLGCIGLVVALSACVRTAPTEPTLLPTRSISAGASPIAAADPCIALRSPVAVAAGSTGPGQVVFIDQVGNLNLYAPLTRKITGLTSDANSDDPARPLRVYKFPTFSPDAGQLLFTSISTSAGTQALTQTVHTMPASAGATLRDHFATGDHNIPYVDWSPDGQTIAYLAINLFGGELRLQPVSSTVSVIGARGNAVYWHWQPKTNSLVGHLGGARQINPDAHMVRIGAATPRSAERISAAPGEFQSPHFAPDGSRIAWVASNGSGSELMLSDPGFSSQCMLTSLKEGAHLAWSPNGSQIAYTDMASPLFGNRPLSLIDLASGRGGVIADNALVYWWSPNGRNLLVFSAEETDRLLDVDGTTVKIHTLPTKVEALRVEVIDAASASKTLIGHIGPSADFAQLIGFIDQYSRALSPWSPDGQTVLISLASPTSPKAYIVRVTLGGAVPAMEPISEGSLGFWSSR